MASNIIREELKAQTRFAFFERKLQADGEGQRREEVRALVRYPWGGRQVIACSRAEELSWNRRLANYLHASGVSQSTSLQAHAWPAVTALRSVVLVGSRGQGKTVGWLLPLLSQLSDAASYSTLVGTGPLAVVLCSNHEEVHLVAATASSVIAESGLDLIVCATSPGPGGQKPSHLTNGCDLLVTTAARLIKLLEDSQADLSRCCHIVLESSHISLDIHRAQIEQTLLLWKTSKKAKGAPNQLVVVGEQWNGATSSFVNVIGSRWRPVLIFSCLLEASIYSSIFVTPALYQSDEQKMSALQDRLHNEHEFGQGVVVVCEDSSLPNLKALLKRRQNTSQVRFLEGECALTAGKMITAWERQGCPGVLVVPDLVCLDLPFLPSSVVRVVCFDLPLLSKKTFSSRLSLLLAGMARQAPGLHLDLLLGLRQLNRPLLSLLPWLHRAAPQHRSLLEAAANLSLKNIAVNLFSFGTNLFLDEYTPLPSPASICWSLAEFGQCGKEQCLKDHAIFEDHERKSREGIEVNFDVLEVESPCTYWVKLWGPSHQKSCARTAIKLARYFTEKQNTRITSDELEVGLQVALKHKGYGCRGVVTEIEEDDRYSPQTNVNVQLIDSGSRITVQSQDLQVLPSDLQSPRLPSSVVKVTVAGLQPAEQEVSWGRDCLREVSGYLGRAAVLGRDAFCRGRVLRTGKDRLFLDRCELLVWQHLVNAWVQLWETKSCLIRDNWAEPQQKGIIHDLIESLSLKPHNISQTPCGVAPLNSLGLKESELPLNQPCPVVVSELFSPSLIFVQRADSLPRLKSLKADIAREGPRLEREEKRALEPGEYVVVQRSDSVWERATVIESSIEKVNLFQIDTGENIEAERENIFHCPYQFQEEPAFAIACSLSQVLPFPDPTCWSTEAGDFLYELTRTDNGDQPTYINCIAVNLKSGKYQVRLIVGENMGVAETLVDHEYAKWDCEVVEPA